MEPYRCYRCYWSLGTKVLLVSLFTYFWWNEAYFIEFVPQPTSCDGSQFHKLKTSRGRSMKHENVCFQENVASKKNRGRAAGGGRWATSYARLRNPLLYLLIEKKETPHTGSSESKIQTSKHMRQNTEWRHMRDCQICWPVPKRFRLSKQGNLELTKAREIRGTRVCLCKPWKNVFLRHPQLRPCLCFPNCFRIDWSRNRSAVFICARVSIPVVTISPLVCGTINESGPMWTSRLVFLLEFPPILVSLSFTGNKRDSSS